MLLDIILLLTGFVVLIYGANKLVDGGSVLAARLNVPNIVIGLTVVAFGTSAPELVVNLVSSLDNNSAIALGNVLGSNIFNILGIAGITAILYPLAVKKTTTWVEVPLTVMAAIILLLMVNSYSGENPAGYVITRAEGAILLFFFALFMTYTFILAKRGEAEEVEIKNYTLTKSTFFILIGLTGLIAGGRMLVSGAIGIAEMLGVSQRIIGLTIISIGTSLPELATSLIAARKNNVDMAIGNVVGSNIFNTFLVLGISAMVNPIHTTADSMLDLMVNVIASLLLFAFIFTGRGRKINRWEGILFTLFYVVYLILLINNEI